MIQVNWPSAMEDKCTFVLNKIRLHKFPWNKTDSLMSILNFLENQEGWLHQYDRLLYVRSVALSSFPVPCLPLFLEISWICLCTELSYFCIALEKSKLLGVIQPSHNIFNVKIRGPCLLHLLLCAYLRQF